MFDHNYLLFDAAASKALDALCIDTQSVSGYELMTQAGQQAFSLLLARYWRAKRVAIFCGSGNNGGDGYVLAWLLHQAGFESLVFCIKPAATDDSIKAAQDAEAAGVKIHDWQPGLDWNADIVVDALLGIGLNAELQTNYLACVREINSMSLPVLAIDVPTGVDADTGRLLPEAVNADATITFITRKAGLYTGSALNVRGKLYYTDLGVSPELYQSLQPAAYLLQSLLPERSLDSHKGSYGRVAAIGGERSMRGAIFLSSHAALKAGAGVVTAFTPDEDATEVHEVMSSQWGVGDPLPEADALVFGPGAGQSDWAEAVFIAMQTSKYPKVIDADALVILANQPNKDEQRIITPHPGEAANLLGMTTQNVQSNRFSAVYELQAKYGGVAVLKGAGTLVCDGKQTAICERGNAGMATAGSGDVLAGIISALLAQGLQPMQAACQGVLIHATAGDMAASCYSQQGLTASAINEYIPVAISSLVGIK